MNELILALFGELKKLPVTNSVAGNFPSRGPTWALPQDCLHHVHFWVRAADIAGAPCISTICLNQETLVSRQFPLSVHQSQCLLNGKTDAATLIFAPLLPGETRERSYPIQLIVHRIKNVHHQQIELSLLAVRKSGNTVDQPAGLFDLQHDNLCLTGSWGYAASDTRHGLSMPDLHHEGIWQQGLEPFADEMDLDRALHEFENNGEVDPRSSPGMVTALGCWVKFDLMPGEVKEVAFAVVNHNPALVLPDSSTAEPHYLQYPAKRRADNAVVWLAEQAFNRFGADQPNYSYWLQAICDWHESLLTYADADDSLAALEELIELDWRWGHDAPEISPIMGKTATIRLTAAANLIGWHDFAAELSND